MLTSQDAITCAVREEGWDVQNYIKPELDFVPSVLEVLTARRTVNEQCVLMCPGNLLIYCLWTAN